jgi:hypothetical protein
MANLSGIMSHRIPAVGYRGQAFDNAGVRA